MNKKQTRWYELTVPWRREKINPETGYPTGSLIQCAAKGKNQACITFSFSAETAEG